MNTFLLKHNLIVHRNSDNVMSACIPDGSDSDGGDSVYSDDSCDENDMSTAVGHVTSFYTRATVHQREQVMRHIEGKAVQDPARVQELRQLVTRASGISDALNGKKYTLIVIGKGNGRTDVTNMLCGHYRGGVKYKDITMPMHLSSNRSTRAAPRYTVEFKLYSETSAQFSRCSVPVAEGEAWQERLTKQLQQWSGQQTFQGGTMYELEKLMDEHIHQICASLAVTDAVTCCSYEGAVECIVVTGPFDVPADFTVIEMPALDTMPAYRKQDISAAAAMEGSAIAYITVQRPTVADMCSFLDTSVYPAGSAMPLAIGYFSDAIITANARGATAASRFHPGAAAAAALDAANIVDREDTVSVQHALHTAVQQMVTVSTEAERCALAACIENIILFDRTVLAKDRSVRQKLYEQVRFASSSGQLEQWSGLLSRFCAVANGFSPGQTLLNGIDAVSKEDLRECINRLPLLSTSADAVTDLTVKDFATQIAGALKHTFAAAVPGDSTISTSITTSFTSDILSMYLVACARDQSDVLLRGAGDSANKLNTLADLCYEAAARLVGAERLVSKKYYQWHLYTLQHDLYTVSKDVFNTKPRVAHVTDPYTAISDVDCAQLMENVRGVEVDKNSKKCGVHEVLDGVVHFEAFLPQNRVFCMSDAGDILVSIAAKNFLRELYIEPAKKCMLALQKRLQYQANVPIETIITEHMQQMTYLSPVFIPAELGSKADHTLLRTIYGSGKDSVLFDEHRYPHLVFYVVPYSTAALDVIASDVLAGCRGADQCSYVIQLPQDTVLQTGAQAVAGAMAQWLSGIAKTRLDAFIVPETWQSWCRSQTVCSLQSERPITPVYALFGMQFSLMQVRHKFLQLSIDKLKTGSVKNTLMQTAIKHLRSPQIGEFIQALNNMEQQVWPYPSLRQIYTLAQPHEPLSTILHDVFQEASYFSKVAGVVVDVIPGLQGEASGSVPLLLNGECPVPLANVQQNQGSPPIQQNQKRFLHLKDIVMIEKPNKKQRCIL